MSYIGLPPKATFSSGLLDRFTSTTGTTVTLTNDIASENDIVVFVNFVKQDSTTYSVGGTGNKTLTLGGTLVSSDIVEVHYLNIVGQTVNPSANSVGSSQLTADSITGQTAETSIATDDTVLIHDTSAGALRKMTRANFVSGIGGTNTPYAHIKLSANQNTGNASNVKVTLDSVELDSASGFDATNDRWVVPSGQAGKYHITGAIMGYSSNGSFDFTKARIYINGSNIAEAWTDHTNNDGEAATETITLIKNLSVGDYIELYGQTEGGVNPSYFGGDSTISKTYLNLFKIIE